MDKPTGRRCFAEAELGRKFTAIQVNWAMSTITIWPLGTWAASGLCADPLGHQSPAQSWTEGQCSLSELLGLMGTAHPGVLQALSTRKQFACS